MANLRRILWYLLGGTRGGPLRIKILQILRERPYNTNQLAEMLDVDYKTAQHHLEVLTENRVVSSTGQTYGAVFIPTPDMEESWEAFDEIVGQVAPEAKEEASELAGSGTDGAEQDESDDEPVPDGIGGDA